MFERYTSEARRSISIAHAVSQLASPLIETEHLLLGLVRENILFVSRFLTVPVEEDSFRRSVMAGGGARGTFSTSLGDMPFTLESTGVLGFAADEAGRMGSQRIGIEHLLVGLLLEGDCVAGRMLRELGAEIGKTRKGLALSPHKSVTRKERVRQEIEKRLGEWRAEGGPVFSDSSGTRRTGGEFERYSISANMAISFAKSRAGRFGFPAAETEHLLIEVLRKLRGNADIVSGFLTSNELINKICQQIEKQAAGEVRDAFDFTEYSNLPLSDECKRVQAHAEEEATLLGHAEIGPEHLLLGLLCEDGCAASLTLREHGIEYQQIRGEVGRFYDD